MGSTTLLALIVACSILGSCILLLLFALIFTCWRLGRLQQRHSSSAHDVEAADLAKLKAAPGVLDASQWRASTSMQDTAIQLQKDVTFVVTDVAGSTELWEWNAEVMDMALQLHDAVLRTLLFKHFGHEVTTEGDSFTVVFHDAMDALQWCLQLQQALLEVNWPHQLLSTAAAGEVWTRREGLALAGTERQLAFRGLRVRMGVHTGNSCTIVRHPVTGQWEYSGLTRLLAEAISDAGYGGQILICDTTFQHIYSRMPMLANSAAEAMMHNTVQEVAARHSGTNALRSANSFTSSGKKRRASALISDLAANLLQGPSGASGPLPAGKWWPRATTITTMKDKESDSSDFLVEESVSSFENSTGLLRQVMLGMIPATRHQDSADNLPMMSARSSMTGSVPTVLDLSGPMVVDMGKCCVKASGQAEAPLRITLVLQNNLAGRLQHWPTELTIPNCTPNYFEAPGAITSLKYIGGMIPSWDRPRLTVCFCSMQPGSLTGLALEVAALLLAQFNNIVRLTLCLCNGYECQEKEGVFMLAFQNAREAMEWGLTLQLAIMEATWPATEVIGEQNAPADDRTGRPVFKGVRARVGMFHGEVVKVVPHSRTGRADYFGLVLNRAARLQGSAHGGQVLADALSVDKAVQEWRVMYQQSPTARSRSKKSKYLPGSIMEESGESLISSTQSSDFMSTILECSGSSAAVRGYNSGSFDRASADLLATSAGIEALKQHEASMLQRSEMHMATLSELPKMPTAPRKAGFDNIDRVSVQVDVHDLGLFSLKGVESHITLSCLLPRKLSGRFQLYPEQLPSSKATRLNRGMGLMDTVTVELPDVCQLNLGIPIASVALFSSAAQQQQPRQNHRQSIGSRAALNLTTSQETSAHAVLKAAGNSPKGAQSVASAAPWAGAQPQLGSLMEVDERGSVDTPSVRRTARNSSSPALNSSATTPAEDLSLSLSIASHHNTEDDLLQLVSVLSSHNGGFLDMGFKQASNNEMPLPFQSASGDFHSSPRSSDSFKDPLAATKSSAEAIRLRKDASFKRAQDLHLRTLSFKSIAEHPLQPPNYLQQQGAGPNQHASLQVEQRRPNQRSSIELQRRAQSLKALPPSSAKQPTRARSLQQMSLQQSHEAGAPDLSPIMRAAPSARTSSTSLPPCRPSPGAAAIATFTQRRISSGKRMDPAKAAARRSPRRSSQLSVDSTFADYRSSSSSAVSTQPLADHQHHCGNSTSPTTRHSLETACSGPLDLGLPATTHAGTTFLSADTLVASRLSRDLDRTTRAGCPSRPLFDCLGRPPPAEGERRPAGQHLRRSSTQLPSAWSVEEPAMAPTMSDELLHEIVTANSSFWSALEDDSDEKDEDYAAASLSGDLRAFLRGNL